MQATGALAVFDSPPFPPHCPHTLSAHRTTLKQPGEPARQAAFHSRAGCGVLTDWRSAELTFKTGSLSSNASGTPTHRARLELVPPVEADRPTSVSAKPGPDRGLTPEAGRRPDPPRVPLRRRKARRGVSCKTEPQLDVTKGESVPPSGLPAASPRCPCRRNRARCGQPPGRNALKAEDPAERSCVNPPRSPRAISAPPRG